VYKEQGEVTLFRTIYQYSVRYGWVGQVVDRLVFRPIMGWATAWSFDRLRLWVEAAIAPELSLRLAVLHALVRSLLAVIFVYHGVVPKWLYPQGGELLMLERTGLVPGVETTLLWLLGFVEVLIGIGLLTLGRSKWLLGAVSLMLAGLTGAVVITQPETLTAPINALTFNAALLGLIAAVWVTLPYVPSAGKCRRKAEGRS
jgi:hypothetical protein